MENSVYIVDPDPRWPRLYEEERARIANPLILDIEHIGSTSVPGLEAKPIIDLVVAVGGIPPSREIVEAFSQLGYQHMGELGIPGRHFFKRGNPRTHNLHMVLRGSTIWSNHVLFRDFLRSHPEVALRYGALKRDLAVRFREDRDAYTDAKAPFITGVLDQARRWKTESRML